MNYYIRFGKWPEDERSEVGEAFLRSRAWVYAAIGEEQEEIEEGVSVYEATWDETKSRWVIPTLGSDSYLATLDEIISQRREIFLVTGDEVGTGSDGEPLLRNVKLVKVLEYSDIYNDHIYDEDAIMEDFRHGVTHRVDFLYKQPGKDPIVVNDSITLEVIKKLLGGYFQMYNILADGVVMLVLELDYPEQNTDINVFWPSLGPIFGPVIITALRSEEDIEEAKRKLPWPWSAREDVVIPGEDYRSLSVWEIQNLQEFLMEISQ